MENAAEDMPLYCKFRKRKSKHNIENIFDSALYKKHFDCGGYFHETDPAARENEIHLLFMVNTDGS